MKQLIASLALIALLVCGLAAQPTAAPPAPTFQPDTPPHGRMHMPGLAPGLDLTADQRSKMEDLQLAHVKEMMPLRTEMEKHHNDLKAELTADKYNESKVRSIQADIAKLESEIAMKQFSHLRAVRDLLTAEQKKKFDLHIMTGGSGFGGMMEHGARPGAGGPGPWMQHGQGHREGMPAPAPMPGGDKS